MRSASLGKHIGKRAVGSEGGDGDGSTGCAADAPVAELSADIKVWFGEIVWVKQRGFPWWPGYVYDPRQLDPKSEIFKLALESVQTHFTVFFLDANKYAIVEHDSVRVWDDFMDTMYKDTLAALPSQKQEKLESAIAQALVELKKPKEGRLWRQHYPYIKAAEESARLRQQRPHWTILSATESRIQLRLVRKKVTEQSKNAESVPVSEAEAATATNAGDGLAAKDDPFMAHATRDVDPVSSEGQPRKKAKKGGKVQKKAKRSKQSKQQLKEEKSVRPASEPLDPKDNFGLYMFGLSHPGWQSLMCGFDLVSKCINFEGYIREQKRYKQR